MYLFSKCDYSLIKHQKALLFTALQRPPVIPYMVSVTQISNYGNPMKRIGSYIAH